MKNILLTVFFIISAFGFSQVKAFPTAYGAGATTTGGRGGTIIHVTTLASTGAGSLREALVATGTRYIVFDVSGVINLTTQIQLGGGNVTINGFTAPYGGVTIIGSAIISDHINNIIWRGIRFRNGYKTSEGWSNATELQHRGCENVIVDKCSFAYANDGAGEGKGVSFQTSTTGVDEYGTAGTIQNCLFGEMKEVMLLGNSAGSYFGNVSVLRNVAVNSGWRFPKVGGATDIDVINNFAHNWDTRINRFDPYDYNLNLIGNYYQGGANTTATDNPEIVFTTWTNATMSPQIWDEDNYIDTEFRPIGYPADPSLAWNPFFSSTDPINSAWFVGSRLALQGEAISILASNDLSTTLFNKVGVSEYIDDSGIVQYYRDSLDTDLITKATTDSGTAKLNSSTYQGLAEAIVMPTNTRVTGFSTLGDGIEDGWRASNMSGEAANAIDPITGYMWIELFYNQIDGAAPPTGNINYTLSDRQKRTSKRIIKNKLIRI